MGDATLVRLQEVFRDVFEDDEIVVGPGTTARDIEAWDSLMHVSLIVAVERRFGVRFGSGDVARLENVGELVELVDRHLAAQARG